MAVTFAIALALAAAGAPTPDPAPWKGLPSDSQVIVVEVPDVEVPDGVHPSPPGGSTAAPVSPSPRNSLDRSDARRDAGRDARSDARRVAPRDRMGCRGSRGRRRSRLRGARRRHRDLPRSSPHPLRAAVSPSRGSTPPRDPVPRRLTPCVP